MFKGMNRKKKNTKGFTLVELIVVVAILGILAAVAVPSIIGYLDNAKVSTDDSNAKEIEAAIMRLAAKGTITLPNQNDADPVELTAEYVAGTIVPAVQKEIEMPTVQRDGFDFYIDINNGRVKCIKDTEASSDQLVLVTPAATPAP